MSQGCEYYINKDGEVVHCGKPVFHTWAHPDSGGTFPLCAEHEADLHPYLLRRGWYINPSQGIEIEL